MEWRILLSFCVFMGGFALGHQRGYRAATEVVGCHPLPGLQGIACPPAAGPLLVPCPTCPACPAEAKPRGSNAGAAFSGVSLAECERLCDHGIGAFGGGFCSCKRAP